ncbi:MAG: 3-deoxy-7-phosphoheptulonate synthase, partial [Gammaproteobacteria bacterium]|nr:3-deoxy-7-phosphoheptulonate synthase [Gammaproteobacteria bacterium]
MIVILQPNIDKSGSEYRALLDRLDSLPNIQARFHEEAGTQ